LEEWLGKLRGNRVYLRTPQRGKKRQLVDLAMTNARALLDEISTREAYKEKAAERQHGI